jgi:hypothetical protein
MAQNFKKSFPYKVRLTIHGPVPYLYFTLGREDPDPPSETRDGILGHQLTYGSSLLLNAIHSAFYRRI